MSLFSKNDGRGSARHVRTVDDEQADLYYAVATIAVCLLVGYVTYSGCRFYTTYVVVPSKNKYRYA